MPQKAFFSNGCLSAEPPESGGRHLYAVIAPSEHPQIMPAGCSGGHDLGAGAFHLAGESPVIGSLTQKATGEENLARGLFILGMPVRVSSAAAGLGQGIRNLRPEAAPSSAQERGRHRDHILDAGVPLEADGALQP